MAKLFGSPNMSVYEGCVSVGKTNNYGILLLDGTEAISPPETSHWDELTTPPHYT